MEYTRGVAYNIGTVFIGTVFLSVFAVVSLLPITVSGFSFHNSGIRTGNVSLGHVSPPFPGFHSPGFIKPTTKTTTRTVSYPSFTTSVKLTSAAISTPHSPKISTRFRSTQSPRRVSSTSSIPFKTGPTGSVTMTSVTSAIPSFTSVSNTSVSHHSVLTFSAYKHVNLTVKHAASTSSQYSRQSSTVSTTDSTSVINTVQKMPTGSHVIAGKGNSSRARAVITFTLVFTLCSTLVFLVTVYFLRKKCFRFRWFEVAPSMDV